MYRKIDRAFGCRYFPVCPDIKKMKETNDKDLRDQYYELCLNSPTTNTCINFRDFYNNEKGLKEKLIKEPLKI